jgi:hypothetical protein
VGGRFVRPVSGLRSPVCLALSVTLHLHAPEALCAHDALAPEAPPVTLGTSGTLE